MGDLLKEAIADAKAVRETALQNAKMALEEAFTPQLKSMLSAKLKEDEFDDEEEFGGEDEEGEEELDLESIIKELEDELSEGEDEDDEDTVDESLFKEEEEEDEDEEVEESNTSELESELKEYKEAVSFLKDKLHEVNILNAKLLFTNKLFKEYALDNNQKLKVVETFDRAQSTREIKLVYSTLAEQFGDNGSINRKSIKESASAKSGSTKPSQESKKVISEEAQVANRFRKLAGILKG